MSKRSRGKYLVFAITVCFGLLSCEKEKLLFEKLSVEDSGIEFRNDLTFSQEFNIFTYRNFYNGGGVAIGDVNNDGLPDIYFTSNLGKNKLYLNKGALRFEDISEAAGVEGTRAWSTGVAMADVNGDGWLDIYVCNSGDIKNDNKQNELFINNGNLTFSESAEKYGLDDRGFSTHAAFFDYDRDGDLDMYMLNNSYQAIGSFNLMNNIRHVRDSVGGDKLYRNDGGHFSDVSEQAGIYGSVIGFGLGVTIGDVNNDGWLDIYVSNDFFEKDYLYINQHDGTFIEELEQQIPSISAASMGADMADINNDNYLDIFVTDMLPRDDKRLKQVTTFENWDKLNYNVRNGYYYQYNRNMLHLNNRNGTFSDIGRLAGVAATDWSWGALIFDMDNDGWKDIFVANGIYQDITDLDYLSFIVDDNTVKKIISRQGIDYRALVDPIPVANVPNFAFRNGGSLMFDDVSAAWGFEEAVHSNGAAYGDLDGDGDLDLVVNNVNERAFVYRNNSREVFPMRHFVNIRLDGPQGNRFAVGARVTVAANGSKYSIEQMPTRGFQSTVSSDVLIAIGDADKVDSIFVTWPDGRHSDIKNPPIDQTITVNWTSSVPAKVQNERHTAPLLLGVPGALPFKHQENEFVDFDRDRLLFHMLSTQGPRMAIGDVNGDGKQDVFVGGARGQAGEILLQNEVGEFVQLRNAALIEDSRYEDVDAAFFDSDGDHDLDLYVVSGGNEFSLGAPELEDRIYLNDGTGVFARAVIPALSGHLRVKSCVSIADMDADGDEDIFVGERAEPFAYGEPVSGIVYRNEGDGRISDVSAKWGKHLQNIGMITDAIWSDFTSDGHPDLVVVGDWMRPMMFVNTGQDLILQEDDELTDAKGWWNCITQVGLDEKGDPYFAIGNHGLNSVFRSSIQQPIKLYVGDFDRNGSIEHIYTKREDENDYPMVLKHDLVAQIPELKKRYLKYKDFNDKTIDEIFSADRLKECLVLSATKMESSLLVKRQGTWKIVSLPIELQFAPVYSIASADINLDGLTDLVAGGNLLETKPQVGRYDASYGLVLMQDAAGGFVPMNASESGLSVRGAIRDVALISTSPKSLAIAVNNDSLRLFRLSRSKK